MAPWPTVDASWQDGDAEAVMATLQELIVEVRRLRKEYGVGEGARIAIHVLAPDAAFAATVLQQAPALERLARVDRVELGAGHGGVGAHAVLKSGVELFLPLEGVIDVEKERVRLAGEIERLDAQFVATEKKLANESFVSRAPAEVVGREREKAAGLRDQAAKLREKLATLQGVGS